MIAISAASNFYFFYMLTWMIFLYALVRYPRVVKGKTWIDFLKWFGYFAGLYLIGLLISSGIFVPIVYGFLNASRSPNFPPISLFFYPLHYYGLLIINSLTPGTIFWTVGGLSVVGVLSLPFLFRRRQQRPGLFWLFLVLGVMLLFPILVL
jgi:Predicted membrane protein